jgi:hypothetical protein
VNDLPIWVIYDHPKDQPEFFIARKWLIGRGQMIATGDTRIGLTLSEVRRKLPIGLARIDRNADDDSKIVECWL